MDTQTITTSTGKKVALPVDPLTTTGTLPAPTTPTGKSLGNWHPLKLWDAITTLSMPRSILLGGVVGGAFAVVVGYTIYRKNKKPTPRLSDKSTPSGNRKGPWVWVQNDYFWFDPSQRRFDSVEQFYTEIKHGGDSEQATKLKRSDLKTTTKGVTYKGVIVLRNSNRTKKQ